MVDDHHGGSSPQPAKENCSYYTTLCKSSNRNTSILPLFASFDMKILLCYRELKVNKGNEEKVDWAARQDYDKRRLDRLFHECACEG